ncbi:MAG: hypothetical protein M0O99_09105 [Desulfuromonas thiophila]|jgi:hypothetical protein|nr:hypothetical protein [Desulfuromonas thiophila]
MSFMTFRNAYLAQAQTRLDAVDLAAADDNRMLVAGALYKMAGSVAQFDLLAVEALTLLESLDGPSLQAWLADAALRRACLADGAWYWQAEAVHRAVTRFGGFGIDPARARPLRQAPPAVSPVRR